jgi:hypothetical protein
MKHECLNCGEDLSGYLPYGSNVVCKRCGQEHVTKWDEIDLDNAYWWIVGKV